MREQRKNFAAIRKNILFGQINSSSLSTTSAKEELDKHMNDFDISVACIEEHRHAHLQDDPYINATTIGRTTMFTASGTRNRQGAAVSGVGVVVKSSLLQNLVSIIKITDRIIINALYIAGKFSSTLLVRPIGSDQRIVYVNAIGEAGASCYTGKL